MLSIVCWKWKPAKGYRSEFSAETVNVLRRMVERHYDAPHRFICVTDDPAGIGPDVEVVPLWKEFADLPSPHGQGNPSCYRRLRMFAPDIAAVLGKRFVSLDLDCVITGNCRPLWDRAEPICLWGDTNPSTFYNGSMILMTAGVRPQVWDRFDPLTSPAQATKAGQFGSDQAWISHCLGPKEARWTKRDGVYSYRNHIGARGSLPADARIVMFHGHSDPWQSSVQAKHSWVKAHYR
jgi:hypothetical protein